MVPILNHDLSAPSTNTPVAFSGRPHDGELRSMVSVEELKRRPSRLPDYAAESQALIALAQSMAEAPEGILQKLAEKALTLCRGQSAGLSILEDADQGKNFHWRALTGAWASHLHGGTPRDFSPCGTVLDRNAPQICQHAEVDFPYFGDVTPLLQEALLVPFYLKGEAVGTVWVVSHDQHRFDMEDLRILTNLGTFASAAYQTYQSLNAMERSQAQITLLAREAEHRAKNVLATVQATVHLTQSDTVRGFKEVIEGRIRALANVHRLFVETRWEGADIHTLATDELSAYSQGREERVSISGPKLLLEPTTAQALAVTFHELATNAAKYGALSVPDGRVQVEWSCGPDEPMVLRWTETDGPPVDPAKHRGFGTQVMENMIGNQLKGELRVGWRREGLACEIILPGRSG